MIITFLWPSNRKRLVVTSFTCCFWIDWIWLAQNGDRPGWNCVWGVRYLHQKKAILQYTENLHFIFLRIFVADKIISFLEGHKSGSSFSQIGSPCQGIVQYHKLPLGQYGPILWPIHLRTTCTCHLIPLTCSFMITVWWFLKYYFCLFFCPFLDSEYG